MGQGVREIDDRVLFPNLAGTGVKSAYIDPVEGELKVGNQGTGVPLYQVTVSGIVGVPTNNADYGTVEEAIAAGYNRILIIGNTTSSANIVLTANTYYIIDCISKDIIWDFDTYYFSTSSGTSNIYIYNTTLKNGDTGSTNNAIIDDDYINNLKIYNCIFSYDGSTSGYPFIYNAGADLNWHIYNCSANLPNYAICLYDQGSGGDKNLEGVLFEHCTINGGGSSCVPFAGTPVRCEFHNMTFTGTFGLLDFQGARMSKFYGYDGIVDIGSNTTYDAIGNIQDCYFEDELRISGRVNLTGIIVEGDIDIRPQANRVNMSDFICLGALDMSDNSNLTNYINLSNGYIVGNFELRIFNADNFSNITFIGTTLIRTSTPTTHKNAKFNNCNFNNTVTTEFGIDSVTFNSCYFSALVTIGSNRCKVVSSETGTGINIIINGDNCIIANNYIGDTVSGAAIIDDNGTNNTISNNKTEAGVDITGATDPIIPLGSNSKY